jgi:hypothetical protein
VLSIFKDERVSEFFGSVLCQGWFLSGQKAWQGIRVGLGWMRDLPFHYQVFSFCW